MIIEKGIIKVVWLPRNSKRICSMMFNNIKEADKFGKTKKDYIIFKLIKHRGMKYFEWEIMPYGGYKEYLALIKEYNKHRGEFDFLMKEFLKFTGK